MRSPPAIHIVAVVRDSEGGVSTFPRTDGAGAAASDSTEGDAGVFLRMIKCAKRVTRIFWTDANKTLVTGHDDGFVRRWDAEVWSPDLALKQNCQATDFCATRCDP